MTVRAVADVQGRGRGRGQCGSAAAELAIVLPTLVVFLAAVLSVGALASAQVRCLDAARTGARLAARGESAAVVQNAAQSAAPEGAVVTLHIGAAVVSVQVRARVSLLLPGRPAVEASGSATAAVEGSGGPAGGGQP